MSERGAPRRHVEGGTDCNELKAKKVNRETTRHLGVGRGASGVTRKSGDTIVKLSKGTASVG